MVGDLLCNRRQLKLDADRLECLDEQCPLVRIQRAGRLQHIVQTRLLRLQEVAEQGMQQLLHLIAILRRDGRRVGRRVKSLRVRHSCGRVGPCRLRSRCHSAIFVSLLAHTDTRAPCNGRSAIAQPAIDRPGGPECRPCFNDDHLLLQPFVDRNTSGQRRPYYNLPFRGVCGCRAAPARLRSRRRVSDGVHLEAILKEEHWVYTGTPDSGAKEMSVAHKYSGGYDLIQTSSDHRPVGWSGVRTRCFASIAVASLLLASGCATQSSSTLTGQPAAAWEGKVLVTPEALPTNIAYTDIGSVKANARAGYSSPVALYPYLADEARTAGANAVFGVQGGRSPSMWSWAAPFASGTAVRVEDPEQLKEIAGDYF